jgi:osmotically inducible protein OsmC
MSKHHASAQWNGPVPTGTGTMQLGKAGPVVPYTLTARVEEEAGTNPEQLIAAAHAGCFSMALTSLIEDKGIDAADVQIKTSAVAHLVRKDDGFWIDRIDLEVRGHVPGMDEATFVALAAQAKETCPVSKLYASAEITLDAALA